MCQKGAKLPGGDNSTVRSDTGSLVRAPGLASLYWDNHLPSISVSLSVGGPVVAFLLPGLILKIK